MTGTADRPLAGVKVIDIGDYIAGPLAAMMLADQGAEVIRIRRPGHGRSRRSMRRSIAANPSSASISGIAPTTRRRATCRD